MKTLLLTTFGAALLTTGALGQITITAADFADAGDNSFISQALEPGIDVSTTGPNSVWDYSYLTPSDQVYKEYTSMSQASGLTTITFGSFAPTRYQASYFTEATNLPIDQITTFLPIPLENIYQFYRKTNDSITSVGYAMQVSGQQIPAKSDTIETKYKFPLNYLDEHFSRGYTDLDLSPIYDAAWIQHRTHSSFVDGWGQITTPYGTFQAIRVQHFVTETDSINFQGNWYGIPVPDSYEYEWLAAGQDEPILRIRTSDLAGSEVVTSVEYKDYFQPTLATSQLEMPEVSVFPNPSSEMVHINFSTEPARLLVISGNGTVLTDLTDPKVANDVNIAEAPAGQYLIVAYFPDGNRSISHFVKQ